MNLKSIIFVIPIYKKMDANHEFTIERIKKELLKQEKIKPNDKYIVLYRSIKNCILNTELSDNWLLPPTRVLAAALKVSRTTVLKAYELLQLEKIILSKEGSGSRVSYSQISENNKPEIQIVDSKEYPPISKIGKSYLKNIKLINRLPNESIAFRPGLPPLDIFPIGQWKTLLNTYWQHVKSSGLSYSKATGIIELKKSICDYLNISRNIKCKHEQLVIVSGSLQSLYLVATTLINKGDEVVLENPVFPNIHSVFRSSKAKLIPLNLDDEGINIKELNQIKAQPKIICVTPSNHYPLGIKMSLNRRKELLDWASRNKALIIENDYENEISNVEYNIPTIFSLDKEDRTIYMGTFNRLLHPSIRLGYMIVPKYLVHAIEALQEHSHRFVSPEVQMVMEQFINKSYLYQHIKNCIKTARRRHDLFKDEFLKNCHSMYIQEKPFSSLHLVAFFKENITAEHEKYVIDKLAENNITAFALSKCYITEPKKFGLILGYSSVRSKVISRKMKIMGKIL